MPVLPEIANYLVNASTRFAIGASTTAIPLWKSSLPPDQPDTALGMFESGGPAPVYKMGSVAFERPTIQVISRSASYAAARDNAEHVFGLLSAVTNQAVTKSTSTGLTAYITISPVQSPFDMGQDAEKRALISCNYVVQKEIS
jgi:hypothetical protein